MGKLWLNNEIVDRLAMLQQTEVGHPGVNQVAIEKDWWVTVVLKALFQTDCRDFLRSCFFWLKNSKKKNHGAYECHDICMI